MFYESTAQGDLRHVGATLAVALVPKYHIITGKDSHYGTQIADKRIREDTPYGRPYGTRNGRESS